MYSILLVLAISFSFITQVITAVSDHRGSYAYEGVPSNKKHELSRNDLSSDSSLSTTHGNNGVLPAPLLKSEFYSPSVQSVLNYQPPTKKLLIVFATTVDSQNDTLSNPVKNTLQMLMDYSRSYSTHCVVFSSTPSIISFASSCGHTVVTNTSRNPFGFPFIRPILEVTRLLFDSVHISYISSDILFSSSLFDLLEAIPYARPPISPIYEVAVTGRDTNETISLRDTTITTLNSLVQSVYETGTPRHVHSSDMFVFSQSTPFRSVSRVVVGRMSAGNALIGIMHKEGGELISADEVCSCGRERSSLVRVVHQGVDESTPHQKAFRKDIHWNNLVLGWNGTLAEYKRIIRQGSLRYCNRIVRRSTLVN
ncbi:hypothetical protein WA538_001387 [Blastocystis sp. DL]